MKPLAALLALTAGVMFAPAAQADGYLSPDEEQFADGTWAATCRYLSDAGVNNASMTVLVGNMMEYAPISTGGDAADIINYTVSTYCPRHWPALVAFGEGYRASH